MLELPAGPFDVIVADPPWRFTTWSQTRQTKAAAVHYDLMSLDDIKALPVADLAARDCLLAMWATQAMIPQALDTMGAWGFRYKTMGAWAKQSPTGKKWAFGTGYILRCAAEFFIIGTRGAPRPEVRNVRNLIVAPNREHSRKPEDLHASLESMFPAARRVELFCREARPGWESWGNEIGKFAEAAE